MAKSGHFSAWHKIILLIILGALIFSRYKYFKSKQVAQTASIFVVSTPLEYGDTSLTGVIQKDSTVGEKGNFYLSLSDGRIITLDAKNIDNLINLNVTVNGYLSPKVDDNSLPAMKVTEIKSN